MDTEHQWTREKLRRSLGRLTERERQVMTLRFGLLDERDQTLEEVSHALHVTRERVRQIEERAWRKLKDTGPDGEAGAFVPVTGAREMSDTLVLPCETEARGGRKENLSRKIQEKRQTDSPRISNVSE